MLLGPELGVQDWHHPNKHHRASNTARPTNPSALPTTSAASKGYSRERNGRKRRMDDAACPCSSPPPASPVTPESGLRCAQRSRETSPMQSGLYLPAEKWGQALSKPRLLAELLASLPKPSRAGSTTSRATLLPEDSQVHFCPADVLKIESISIIVLQANIEKSHPHC